MDIFAPGPLHHLVTVDRYRRHVCAHLEQIALLTPWDGRMKKDFEKHEVVETSADIDAASQEMAAHTREGLPKDTEPDIYIAVMGPSGSGKTTFIKHCCGGDHVGMEHSFSPDTHVAPYRTDIVPDRNLWLVYVPSFNSESLSESEVLRELTIWLSNGPMLSGILYLHPIHQTKITMGVKRCSDLTSLICGPDANLHVATTFWDHLNDKVGKGREGELKRLGLWKNMVSGKRPTFRHHNTRESARQILDTILRTNSTHALRLQRELIDASMVLSETTAGKYIAERLEIERQRCDEGIQAMRDELVFISDHLEIRSLEREMEIAGSELAKLMNDKLLLSAPAINQDVES